MHRNFDKVLYRLLFLQKSEFPDYNGRSAKSKLTLRWVAYSALHIAFYF
jgi:hypothetical protein